MVTVLCTLRSGNMTLDRGQRRVHSNEIERNLANYLVSKLSDAARSLQHLDRADNLVPNSIRTKPIHIRNVQHHFREPLVLSVEKTCYGNEIQVALPQNRHR